MVILTKPFNNYIHLFKFIILKTFFTVISIIYGFVNATLLLYFVNNNFEITPQHLKNTAVFAVDFISPIT